MGKEIAESILASPKVPPTKPPAISGEFEQLTQHHDAVPTAAFEELSISGGGGNARKPVNQWHRPEAATKSSGENTELCNLFLGDLSRTVTEDQIREVFSRHGQVVQVDIKRDKVTNNNLGYGFVQFQTRSQAEAAKEHLHGVEIGNRKIRIGWAQKNTTLFVGDLDGTISTEQLRSIFGKFGPLVEDETFVKAGSGRFGFVRFRHRADAETAKSEMNRKVIGSRAVRIGWGDNNIQKHCVHVQFNPIDGSNLEESHFRGLFEPFGPVTSVSLPRFTNGQLKGYGFVHFEDSEEGEKVAGKAIGVLGGESTLMNVTIRCSYGKKQVHNKRRQHKYSPWGRGGQNVMMSGLPMMPNMGVYQSGAGWMVPVGTYGAMPYNTSNGSNGVMLNMGGLQQQQQQQQQAHAQAHYAYYQQAAVAAAQGHQQGQQQGQQPHPGALREQQEQPQRPHTEAAQQTQETQQQQQEADLTQQQQQQYYVQQGYYPQMFYDPNYGTYVQGYGGGSVGDYHQQYQQYYDQAAAQYAQLDEHPQQVQQEQQEQEQEQIESKDKDTASS